MRDIIRLDEEMMVWSDDGAAAVIESIMPFFAIAGVVISLGGIGAGVSVLSDPMDSFGMRALSVSLAALLAVGGATGAYFAWRISFGSKHSDIYFLRKQRKIFHYTNKTAFVLDWDNVRPNVRLGFGPPQLGSRPFVALELVEYLRNDPQTWRARFVVEAPMPGREACQQSWELIRRYMDEAPAALPMQTVVNPRSWTSALLEFGPLSEGGDALGFIQGLRDHNWQPFWSGEHLLAVLWSGSRSGQTRYSGWYTHASGPGCRCRRRLRGRRLATPAGRRRTPLRQHRRTKCAAGEKPPSPSPLSAGRAR